MRSKDLWPVAVGATLSAALIGGIALNRHTAEYDTNSGYVDPTFTAPRTQPLAPLDPGTSPKPKNNLGLFELNVGDKVTRLRFFNPQSGRHGTFKGKQELVDEDLVVVYSLKLSKELKKYSHNTDPGTGIGILLTESKDGHKEEGIQETRIEFNKRTNRVTLIGKEIPMKHTNAEVLPTKKMTKALGYTIMGNTIHTNNSLGIHLEVHGNPNAQPNPKLTVPHRPLPGTPSPIPALPSHTDNIYT
jgi:hypothetical protein